jgi:hypothetical protein
MAADALPLEQRREPITRWNLVFRNQFVTAFGLIDDKFADL